MSSIRLRTTSMAVGGEAVAREASGRVVFVAGGIPDETVVVDITEERRSFARAVVREVVTPSPHRVQPPCPNVVLGCGGCDWQHVAPDAQRRLRLEVVREVLTRDGRIADPVVEPGPDVPAERVRTTVRGTVGPDGRFAFRRRRSHDPIEVGTCLISHPLVEELIEHGRFGSADGITIRVGARTGERMVVASPDATDVSVPDDVIVVGADELRAGRRAWIHEEAAGRRWRVSAGSFFQASPEGAEALVDTVERAVSRLAPEGRRLVDLCGGVGLFAATVGRDREVVLVERSGSATADARHNLAGTDARVIKVAMDRWRPGPADIVVADPARSGLGAPAVAHVAATGADLCVLVSCDPGALGRDARLLGEAGFIHAGSEVIDLFGHTGQVEVVSAFVRSPEQGRSTGR